MVEADRFAERDGQIDTDYVAALLAARNELARVADPATPGGACTAILWFTDGEYDIEARATGETKPYAPDLPLTGPEAVTALEERGRDLLCRDGGLVDALRGEGTEILAVALSSDIPPPDRDCLRAVAEGEAEGLRCEVARPAGSRWTACSSTCACPTTPGPPTPTGSAPGSGRPPPPSSRRR